MIKPKPADARTAQALVGRVIVQVDLQPFRALVRGRTTVAYNPELHLDDGSKLTFYVLVTDAGENAIVLGWHKPKPKR